MNEFFFNKRDFSKLKLKQGQKVKIFPLSKEGFLIKKS